MLALSGRILEEIILFRQFLDFCCVLKWKLRKERQCHINTKRKKMLGPKKKLEKIILADFILTVVIFTYAIGARAIIKNKQLNVYLIVCWLGRSSDFEGSLGLFNNNKYIWLAYYFLLKQNQCVFLFVFSSSDFIIFLRKGVHQKG